MKHLLLLLLLGCNIITSMETPVVTFDFLKVYRDGDRIVASAWVYGAEGFYSVEKNIKNNTFSMDRIVPTNNELLGIEGTNYQPVTDEPEIFAAFAHQINAFEEKHVNALQSSKTKPAAKSALKKKSSFRALFSKK